MKRCGHLEADTNETMQVIPELRREVRVAVTDNVVREPVELVYLVKDKLRDVFSAVGSARRCQVHHGCEMINENTDHVEMSMAIRRTPAAGPQNPSPWSARGRVGTGSEDSNPYGG